MPFSHDEFFAVFAAYNHAIWPAQLVAYLGAVAALALVPMTTAWSARTIWWMLAAMWIWQGVAYHIGHFSTINPAAHAFGAAFIVQGVLFVFAGTRRGTGFRLQKDLHTAAASTLILYATIVYPLLGYVAGHGGMSGPLFGVAPCPSTIFTFGILLLCRSRVPAWLLVIPTLWALIGTTAAVALGVPEDIGLLAAVVITWTARAERTRSRVRVAETLPR